jgi:hypothetical protein
MTTEIVDAVSTPHGIDAAIDSDVDAELAHVIPPQFAIVDENSANWLVKKIVGARQYALRVKEWSEKEQRRAEREEHALLFMFGRQLEGWTKDEVAKLRGRRKSLNLPAGQIGFRRVNAKLVIDDDKRVLAWAKLNCPQAVVVVEKLGKSALDSFFSETGVIPIDGARLDPEEERFFIR